MPVEFNLWRIGKDDALTVIAPVAFDKEERLERILHGDIAMLGLDLLILDRQVLTAHGKRIDLLGIDQDGDLHVIELKRDRTPREVVAQVLDYGSWVQSLSYKEATAIFAAQGERSFEETFAERFGASPPETINENHHLVIVASDLDASTERIVTYLSESYGVPINVLVFRYMKEDDREYLARSWLVDPQQAEARAAASPSARKKAPWNGSDFYVSFGEGRRAWEDAQRFGFVSGGGDPWFSRTLSNLQPGNRVFVCIPQRGYVGVGIVLEPSKRINDFAVKVDGRDVPIAEAPLTNKNILQWSDDSEKSEYVVRVEWQQTLPMEQAIWEKGMFANQNTACKLTNQFTLERLTALFGLSD